MEIGNSTLLIEALQFYKLSILVVKSKPDIDNASDFIMLANYHNMAHIYCTEEMRECFDALCLLPNASVDKAIS